jgi:hypothetical protein
MVETDKKSFSTATPHFTHNRVLIVKRLIATFVSLAAKSNGIDLQKRFTGL